MPLIAHSPLPTYEHLQTEGEIVLSSKRAKDQEIRELHIGILNIMPDTAISATERQFFRLIGRSNQIAQFYLHLFTLPNIPRSKAVQQYITTYYKTIDEIKEQGLDALIITGANLDKKELSDEVFFDELKDVVYWAYEHVTSTFCSCLATHAVCEILFNEKRQHQGKKHWGVFEHTVSDRSHPLVQNIDTKFDAPHSRYNDISRSQFENFGARVLVEGSIGVHLAISPDLLRMVFVQGHPEYDTISLLKEYKRELILRLEHKQKLPAFPANYLNNQAKAILEEYIAKLIRGTLTIHDFPESLIKKNLHNTWASVSAMMMNNWIGLVYQTTNKDIKKPFMDGLDKDNPLGLR